MKTATEIFNLLHGACGEDILSRACMFELHKKELKNRPDLWSHGQILYQENTLAHKAILVCQFLDGKQIPLFKHTLYSPDPALC
jgi:hypothetical protein